MPKKEKGKVLEMNPKEVTSVNDGKAFFAYEQEDTDTGDKFDIEVGTEGLHTSISIGPINVSVNGTWDSILSTVLGLFEKEGNNNAEKRSDEKESDEEETDGK